MGAGAVTWYQIVVFVHVISAIIWVGGIFFLGIIAVPAARTMQPQTRSHLLNELGSRFRAVGYTLLALLIITGTVQAVVYGATWENVLNGSFFKTHFGSRFGIKMLFFIAMLGVSIAHDFFVGPASVRAAQAGKDMTHLRKAASWLARLTALLALGVVLFAVLMVR